MARFCEYCGRKLEEGENCDCQIVEEDASEIKENSMDGKSYSFISSPFMCLSINRGKIFTDVDMDGEKMNIKISPKRKNKVPTVYFKDVKEVNVSVKISIYSMVCAMAFLLVGVVKSSIVCCLLGVFWVWFSTSRRIRISLKDGRSVDIYSTEKALAEEFVNELSKVLN